MKINFNDFFGVVFVVVAGVILCGDNPSDAIFFVIMSKLHFIAGDIEEIKGAGQ